MYEKGHTFRLMDYSENPVGFEFADDPDGLGIEVRVSGLDTDGKQVCAVLLMDVADLEQLLVVVQEAVAYAHEKAPTEEEEEAAEEAPEGEEA